jgi:hypothetical protein
MTDTGDQVPSATGGTYDFWTTPTNAYSSNNSYAYTSGTLDLKQDYYNFGFSIPAGSTINGITVTIEAHSLSATGKLYVALSYDGGSNWTSTINHTDIATGADQNYTYGGASNTWGRTWSAPEFSNANFKVFIERPSDLYNVYVDIINVKVTYTSTAAGGTASAQAILL